MSDSVENLFHWSRENFFLKADKISENHRESFINKVNLGICSIIEHQKFHILNI